MTTNGGPTAANDADRLPWLEPYRDAAKKRVPSAASKSSQPRRRRGFIVAVFVSLLIAVGGGFWLGQLHVGSVRREPALVDQRKFEPIEVAQAPRISAPLVVEQETEENGPNTAVKARSSKKSQVKKSAPGLIHRGLERREKLKRRPLEGEQLAKVLGKHSEVPVWPKMPSPGPAGQVIQLGAFSSPSRAESVYQARAGRYPILATMPKVVVPVMTKPGGEILYVLRLGTQSREQSTIVCSNLRDSGDHCLVIG